MEMQAGSRAAEQGARLVAGWMSDENIVGPDGLYMENTDDGTVGQSERQSGSAIKSLALSTNQAGSCSPGSIRKVVGVCKHHASDSSLAR